MKDSSGIRSRLLLALFVLFCGSGIAAQATWQFQDGITSRRLHAMAFDAARNQTVIFGGTDGAYLDETWVWDGTSLEQLAPVHSPSARGFHLMAYDSVRQRVLLYGGSDGVSGIENDLWSWDGTDWTEIVTATSPPPAGDGAQMAYDPVRDRLVLWRGTSATSAQLWEFDGLDWSVMPFSSPWPGFSLDESLTFDADAGAIALFRRTAQSGMWRWDGESWSHDPGPSFFENIGAVMLHDPVGHRLLLAAGGSTNVDPPTMFVWDGASNSWTLLQTGGPAMSQGGVVFDTVRNTVVAVGGVGAGQVNDSTVWEWSNGPWLPRTSTPPSARSGHHLAYDRTGDRMFLFGGEAGSGVTGDTWVRTGDAWQILIPSPVFPFPTATSPGRPRDARIVFDEARDELLLMGGDEPSFLFYRLVGNQWQEIAGVTPSARENPSVAYDRARGRVILFGGGDFPYSNETWAWDGVAWTDLDPVHAPTARANAAMAYDALRDRMVLIGGNSQAGNIGDTWEFDGVDWELVDTLGPAGLSGSQLAYDEARQTVVGYATPSNGNDPAETWQWHGTGWQRIALASTPSVRLEPALAPEPDGVYAFGGRIFTSSTTYFSDSYRLRGAELAAVQAFGTPGVSSAGPLQLSSVGSLPWLDGVSKLRIESLPMISLPGLWSGFSNSQWQGVALPLDLAFLGFAGNQLLVSLDGPWPVLDLGTGRAEAEIPIPPAQALIGLDLHFQGFVFEPLSGELTASNGLTLTIGVR